MMMTAKELLDQLLDLQKERADFDDLEVYLCVVDQKTYDEENADPPIDGELVDNVLGEGSAYALVTVTEYDCKVTPIKEIGDYLLIRGIELEPENATKVLSYSI